MTEQQTDRIGAALNKLKGALEAGGPNEPNGWIDTMHQLLGRLASAIQEEVRSAEKSKENVGDINPDFQNAPVTERHVEGVRDQWIQIGESIYQLRAELRQSQDLRYFDVTTWRQRVDEIAKAVEEVRHSDDEFLLKTLNSNPGAGE